MPNGGRQGDNPQSWFMDDLCSGKKTFMGDPIDSLACEIYRISRHEGAAGINHDDKKDEIDPIELEAKLRERLAYEKRNREHRIEKWINSDTSRELPNTPYHIVYPVKDTVKYAMNYCSDLTRDDCSDTRQVDELMYRIDILRAWFSNPHYKMDISILDSAKRELNRFDAKKWKDAPNFVAYLESAINMAKK